MRGTGPGRQKRKRPAARAARGRVRVEVHPDGATLYGPSSAANRFYLLRRGRIRLMRQGNGGVLRLTDVLRPGDLFGEMAGVGGTGDEEAVASGESETLSVSVQDFRALMEVQPDLAADVIRALHQRMRALRRRVLTLATRDVRARLAQTLADLFGAHGAPCRHGGAIELRGITHADLADLIGAARAGVSVRLSEMRRAGVLLRTGWAICASDPRRLAERVRTPPRR